MARRRRTRARVRRASLRTTLTLWMAVPSVALLWLAMAVLLVSEDAALGAMLDARVEGWARRIADRVASDGTAPGEPALRAIAEEVMGRHPGRVFEVRVEQAAPGPAGLASDGTPQRPHDIRVEGVGTARVPSAGAAESLPAREARVRLPAPEEGGRVLALAVDDVEVHALRSTQLHRLILVGVAGTLLMVLAAWVVSDMAVAPLRQLRRMAAALYDGGSVSVPDRSIEVAQLTRELAGARDRFMAELQAKANFLANVSHELRTPIAVILTESQVLDRASMSSEARAFLDSVKVEMLRLGRVLESFLTLVRIEGGRQDVRFVDYSVNELVMDAVGACFLMARQYGVQLEPTLLCEDETLDSMIRGDPELLATLVTNLVRNAIQFSPQGGRVEIKALCAGPFVEIVVSDAGPGVPIERLPTIFERFSDADAPGRRGRSHGLGLSIAQGIARVHGGSVRASNRAGGGCDFIVQLPTAQARS